MARGEHGRQVREPERSRLSSPAIGGGPPVPGEHPGHPLAGGSGLPGELRAEARRGDRHRGARRRPAGGVELGEVGGQGHIMELASVEPGVEPPERAGVGPPRVRADRGLDQAARGRRRPPDRGRFGVGPGGPIIHVKGNARPIFIRSRAGTCYAWSHARPAGRHPATPLAVPARGFTGCERSGGGEPQ